MVTKQPRAGLPAPLGPSLDTSIVAESASPPMPPCLAGLLCTSVTRARDVSTILPIMDQSLQALNAALQEALERHSNQLNQRLDVLYKCQETTKEEVVKVSENMRSTLARESTAVEQKKLSGRWSSVEAPGLRISSKASGGSRGSQPVVSPTHKKEFVPFFKQSRTKYFEAKEQGLGLGRISAISAPVPLTKSDGTNSIPIVNSLAERVGKELCAMVLQQVQIKSAECPVIVDTSCSGYCKRFLEMDIYRKEAIVDAFMGGLIACNALTIGVSLDHQSDFFTGLDLFFSTMFVLELIIKLSMFGFRRQYCGPGSASNIFDTWLIFIDILQMVMQHFLWDQLGSALENSPSASMFRVVRLFRLIRLLKLLRLPIFSDLIAMITGLIGGMTTLVWSCVLLITIIYVVALMFREFFGNEEKRNIHGMFNTVPRSMFTVFRCAFGDCSSEEGVPIFEWVTEAYGGFFSLIYCIFVFVVTIGLFNVISAIFVESTMVAAAAVENSKKQDRLRDKNLWATRVTMLVTCFMEYCGKPLTGTSNMESELAQMLNEEVSPEVFYEWVSDERITQALNDLDINPDDHAFLFDILDCDNSGSMFITEIIDGILRLRGEQRRSDIITVDLMIRSIQGQCNMLVEGMATLLNAIQ